MGERKVLNKYYPPDFDPSLIPKNIQSRNRQIKIRTMLPFSVVCNTCQEYIWRARKFNARKEEVLEETYKGVKIWRFYIKCTLCSSEITWKTDPENGSYVVEHGASLAHKVTGQVVMGGADDGIGDGADGNTNGDGDVSGMDALEKMENRQEESRREMDALERLSGIKERVDRQSEIGMGIGNGIEKLDKEEEEKIERLFGKKEKGKGVVRKRVAGKERKTSLFMRDGGVSGGGVGGGKDKERVGVEIVVKKAKVGKASVFAGYSSSDEDSD